MCVGGSDADCALSVECVCVCRADADCALCRVCVCVFLWLCRVCVSVPVAQWLEHCVSSAKIVSFPENTCTDKKKCIA